MFYKHAIIFLRDSTLSLKYEYVLCTEWTMGMTTRARNIRKHTVLCTLYCIAFDHYSIQNKDIHQHKHSLLSILIIHEDFYNTILFSSKWRWCISPYTAYIIRNSFLWNSNCVNFLLNMHIFFSLNPWSTSTKKKMQMVSFYVAFANDPLPFDDFLNAKRANVHAHLITSWFFIWIKSNEAHLLRQKCASKKTKTPMMFHSSLNLASFLSYISSIGEYAFWKYHLASISFGVLSGKTRAHRLRN